MPGYSFRQDASGEPCRSIAEYPESAIGHPEDSKPAGFDPGMVARCGSGDLVLDYETMSYLGQDYPVVYGDVAQDPFTGQYIHPATGQALTPGEIAVQKQAEAASDAAATQQPFPWWLVAVALALFLFAGGRR